MDAIVRADNGVGKCCTEHGPAIGQINDRLDHCNAIGVVFDFYNIKTQFTYILKYP